MTSRPKKASLLSRFGGTAGGVAPFVPPKGRLRRSRLKRRWERRGFVPLSPGRVKLRHRILPRTVIGISFMLLSFGLGAAFSGASFYAYYDARLSANEETVSRFVDGFDQQFTDAANALDELRLGAVDDVRAELGPLEDYVDNATGVVTLPDAVGDSVWRVETRDEEGRTVSGAAFAVADHDGRTAFLTSLSLVVSSTEGPSPDILLLKGTEQMRVVLWTWDAERDLAVLVGDRTVPHLALADDDTYRLAIGQPAFGMAGVGSRGSTATPGVLLDRSDVGLQHSVPLGQLYVGGPILAGDGTVLGVATSAYEPYGVGNGDISSAPDVAGICAQVLDCPDPSRGIVVVPPSDAEPSEDGTAEASPDDAAPTDDADN